MAKIISTVLIILILWIQYHIWYGKKGYQKLSSLEIKITEQNEFNNSLREQNTALKHEIDLMRNNPKVLEEKAREHLGLIKKGEVFYRVIPSEND